MIARTSRAFAHSRNGTPTALGAVISLTATLLNSSPANAAGDISVPAGDTEAFILAIETANASPETTVIHLEGGAPYEFDLGEQAPGTVSGDIVVLGDGAEFAGRGDDNLGRLFEIEAQGRLEIRDIVIRDFVGEDAPDTSLFFNAGTLEARDLRIERITSRIGPGPAGGEYFRSLIVNHGNLDLDRVRVSDITIHAADREVLVPIVLDNAGLASLRNVLMVDSNALEPASPRPFGYLIKGDYFATAGGLASVGVSFSTLVGSSDDLSGLGDVRPYWRQCYPPGLCASIGTTASMIIGLPCPFDGSSGSGGFNLTTDDQCDLHHRSDLIGVSPGNVKFDRDDNGGIRLAFEPFSPGVDRISGARLDCPARDAARSQRNTDGNFNGIPGCDIGAFENRAGSPVLEGGENGLFYSADADGHYVSVEEVRPHEYVIFWNTFDLDGNQAWVLAVGSRQGDRIVGDAFFQPEGVLIPGQGALVNTDALQAWGTVTVTPHDCLSGTFAYDSALDQFGSGSFPLDRLGLTQGIGCRD